MENALLKFTRNIFVRILAYVLLTVMLLLLVFDVGFRWRLGYTPWKPDYPREDIGHLVDKESLTDEDYGLLYRQTGLTRIGVDRLRDAGAAGRMLAIQEDFFADYSYEFSSFAPFMGTLRLEKIPAHTILESGDIVFSPVTFLSMFAIGHSGIVMDGGMESIVTAFSYRQKSGYGSAATILRRPSFMVLRVKANDDKIREVVRYVEDNLLGLDYDIFAGAFGAPDIDELTTTHCAHIIWYAYNACGIDLDENGWVMLPSELPKSSYVEVVQIYGMDIY